jgi:hypothetical protein
LNKKTKSRALKFEHKKVGKLPEGLDVRDGHSEDGELVRLPGEGVAGGHHVRQLRDVGGHLVPSPPLDFAVILAGKPLLGVLTVRIIEPVGRLKKRAGEGGAVLRIRIRIRIHFGQLDPDPHRKYESGSRRAKITHKSEENSCFEVPDVLF